MPMGELKQCPFCGGKAELKTYDRKVYVQCSECQVAIKCVWISADYCANDKAAEAWNMRAGDLNEVEPVRRGHWVELPKSCQADYECSECGAGIGAVKPPYCAYCGAKMDKE